MHKQLIQGDICKNVLFRFCVVNHQMTSSVPSGAKGRVRLVPKKNHVVPAVALKIYSIIDVHLTAISHDVK